MTHFSDVKGVFGRALKYWRGQSGLSQEKLAERADLHRTYIAGVESGARNPSLISLHKLARALGISLETLFSAARPAASGPTWSVPHVPPDICPNILVVEPRERLARALLNTFHRSHVVNRVVLVDSSAEAIAYTHHTGRYAADPDWRPPGLILLDVTAADATALRLIERLQADKLANRVRVIVVLASPREWPVARRRGLGGQGRLVGPFNLNRVQQGLVGAGFHLALVR